MKLKTFNILAIVCVLATIASCNEEDNTAANESNLPGEWVLRSLTTTDCDDATNNEIISYDCNSTICTTYIFSVDTAMVEKYVIRTLEDNITINKVGEYSISGDNLSLCIDNEGVITCDEYTMILLGSTLSLLQDNPDTGCEERLSLDVSID